jgi:Rieske Fe-S protein
VECARRRRRAQRGAPPPGNDPRDDTFGGAVSARLLICTHEFCDLFWHDVDNAYRCTCHDARFAPDGSPRSGPVSKPMFELPAHIEGDRVLVGPAGELALTG